LNHPQKSSPAEMAEKVCLPNWHAETTYKRSLMYAIMAALGSTEKRSFWERTIGGISESNSTPLTTDA
jgi:hypothetical protein